MNDHAMFLALCGLNEDPRPGFTKLAEQIQHDNPGWSTNLIIVEAKYRYDTQPRRKSSQ